MADEKEPEVASLATPSSIVKPDHPVLVPVRRSVPAPVFVKAALELAVVVGKASVPDRTAIVPLADQFPVPLAGEK
jgi:hypothetical protein